jgi:hypothetical protein
MANWNNINLNLNVRGLSPSATLAINEKSLELIKSGRQVYRMGLGQSPFPSPKGSYRPFATMLIRKLTFR